MIQQESRLRQRIIQVLKSYFASACLAAPTRRYASIGDVIK